MIVVNFQSEASAEIEATVEFYESRLEDLGIRFLSAVESGIERIAAFPESGSRVDEGIRKVTVAGFPYSIIYRNLEGNILILAVAHHYRLPGYWLNRSQED